MRNYLIWVFAFLLVIAGCTQGSSYPTLGPFVLLPPRNSTPVPPLQPVATPTSTQIAQATNTPVVATRTPTPQATNTAVSVNTPTAAAVAKLCPTDIEAQRVLEVQVINNGTEDCAWTWNSKGAGSTVVTCPSGWVCTIHRADNNRIVVQLGLGQKVGAVAFTARYIKGYNPPVEACDQTRQEDEWGRSRILPFRVVYERVPGAPECPGR